MQATWQAEKDLLHDVGDAKEAIENLHREAEQAERGADLQRAAELRYGRIPEAEKRLAHAEARVQEQGGGYLKEEVDAEDIAEVVATGVELCLVIGGGNIFRGVSLAGRGMERASAD